MPGIESISGLAGANQFGGAVNAPASTPGSVGGFGQYTPDWAALIKGDYGLKDAMGALSASGVTNQQQLTGAVQNAYEQFGKPVDLASLAQKLGMNQSDLQNMLGPDQQKLAQENTDAGLSTTARVDQANKIQTAQDIAKLNARGALNSGATGTTLGQDDLTYRQQTSDAYQQFLGYLQQYQQGYTAAQESNAQALAQAYSAAADRQVALHSGAAGQTGAPDHIDPATGQWVFKTPDGQLWNGDKTPYTPSAPAPPPAASPPPVNLPSSNNYRTNVLG